MCRPLHQQASDQCIKESFTTFVYGMGNRSVLDCLAVMKGVISREVVVRTNHLFLPANC